MYLSISALIQINIFKEFLCILNIFEYSMILTPNIIIENNIFKIAYFIIKKFI